MSEQIFFDKENTSDIDTMEASSKKSHSDEQKMPEILPEEENKSAELEQKISGLEAELSKTKDQLLRLAAEYDNFRKISVREASNNLKYANEQLILNLLPLMDNLAAAVQAGQKSSDKSAQDLVVGVQMVLKLLNDTLEKYGVKSFEALGQKFDPMHHEAVLEEENESVLPGTVIVEHQRGFKLHERLLRPARVSVAKAASKDQDVK